jgi:transcription elongation factor B subunit 1
MAGQHSGAVLEYVAQYMQYWYMYKDKEDVPDMDIPVDLCLEVLMAADFLRMDRKSAAARPRQQSTNISPCRISSPL